MLRKLQLARTGERCKTLNKEPRPSDEVFLKPSAINIKKEIEQCY